MILKHQLHRASNTYPLSRQSHLQNKYCSVVKIQIPWCKVSDYCTKREGGDALYLLQTNAAFIAINKELKYQETEKKPEQLDTAVEEYKLKHH